MGVHSCTNYCHLHPDAHDILKYELDDMSCYLEPDELKVALLLHRQRYDEFLTAVTHHELNLRGSTSD